METEKIKNEFVTLLKDKKANNLISIDVKDITSLTDYFIICSGTSDRHRKSLADDVVEKARELGLPATVPPEGYDRAKWILIDCIDVVVNIFEKETREKYNLEKLWSDGVLEEIRKSEENK